LEFRLGLESKQKKAALVTFSAFAFPNQVVTFSDLLLSRISCFPSRLYGVVLAGLCPASIAICWSLCICGCSWTSWMRIHREVNSSSCVASVILFPLKLANPCIIYFLFLGKGSVYFLYHMSYHIQCFLTVFFTDQMLLYVICMSLSSFIELPTK